MRRIFWMLGLACFSFTTLPGATAWSAESGELAISPEVLNIGTFYAGGQVTISGEVPDGQDVVVEVAGPATNGKFDLKGRVGPFWMTNGRAELNGAPSMYVLLLPGGQDWHREAAALGLGLDQLRGKVSMQSSSLAPDELFKMFLELKKSEGLYGVQDNAVTYAAGQSGTRRFTALCRFPRSTAAGSYTIKATAIANGAKGLQQSGSLLVDEVGFARLVYDLATNRRLAYGILAVVIALFAGAVMGVLFKGGGRH
jgi:hypothetical protein